MKTWHVVIAIAQTTPTTFLIDGEVKLAEPPIRDFSERSTAHEAAEQASTMTRDLLERALLQSPPRT